MFLSGSLLLAGRPCKLFHLVCSGCSMRGDSDTGKTWRDFGLVILNFAWSAISLWLAFFWTSNIAFRTLLFLLAPGDWAVSLDLRRRNASDGACCSGRHTHRVAVVIVCHQSRGGLRVCYVGHNLDD